MKRNRLLSALAVAAFSASLLAPAAAMAKPTITMSGSTSVAPLASLLARKYLSVCGHCVNFKLLQGGSDIGVADVAAGRVTIGNSSRDPKPSDPGGLVFTKIARDAVCIITNNANPIPTHRPGRRAGDLRRQRAHLEQRPRRERSRHDRRRRPHPRLWYPGRLPAHLHGLDQGLRRRQPEDLERPDPAAGQVGPGRRSATSPSSSPKASTRSPTRACRAPCATPSPGQYGGERNFYMVTRGAANGRGEGLDQLDHPQRRRGHDRRHRLGAAALVRIAPARQPTGSRAGPHGPAHRAAARCALRLRVLLLIGFMIVFVFAKAWPSFSHNGLAWFGSGGNVDEQLDNIFNSPANPANYVYTLHAWPLLYATVADHRRRRAARRRRSRCSRRCSSSSSRRRGWPRCCSRWCGCSPRCRR